MWSNCFKYCTRCKLFCILLCLVIWRDLATMDENGYVKIIGRIKVCFLNISSLKHSKQQSLICHTLMKIEDPVLEWNPYRQSWRIFVKAPRGLPYKKRALVGNFEKNPSEVPMSCFVSQSWIFFTPNSKKNGADFFQLNTQKGIPKASAVELLRLNTLRDAKTVFSTPRYDEHPHPFYMRVLPLPGVKAFVRIQLLIP